MKPLLLLHVVVVLVLVYFLDHSFSFPAPEVQFPTAAAKFNVTNSLTKAIFSWADNRGVIYKQADPFQQPNLVSVRANKNAVAFIPKNVLQSK